MAIDEARYRSVLSSLGLSQEAVDYISTRKDPKAATRIYWTGIFIYVVLYIGLTVAAAFAGYHLLFLRLMEARTQHEHAIFYDAVWWGYLFPGIFLSIFLPAYVVYVILERFPRAAELVALKSIDDMVRRSAPRGYNVTVAGGAAGAMERKFIDDTFRQLPIHEALLYYNRKSLKWSKRGTLAMIVLILPFLVMDASNYILMTPKGVTYAPYGSFVKRHESWQDVTRVETGCGSTGEHSSNLRYDVFFKDGTDVDLLSVETMHDPRTMAEKVKAINEVNAILDQMHVPIQLAVQRYGVGAGRKLADADCFDNLKQNFPEDYANIVAALKLEKYQKPQ